MATFVTLPVELIQSIAAWCRAPDILRLSQTCQLFQAACDEPAVFQHSFEAHLSEPISSFFQDKNALVHFVKPYVEGPKKPSQLNEGPTATWRCLAVAAARIPDATVELERLASSVKLHATLDSQQLGQDTEESLHGVLGLLSTLPIWGYSATCSSVVAATLDSLCPILFPKSRALQQLRIDRSLSTEKPVQFAFCLALSGLQLDDWQQSKLASTENGDPRIPLGPGTDALRGLVKSVFERERPRPDYAVFEESYIGRHTHALLLSVLITRNLQYVSKQGQTGLLPLFSALRIGGTGRRVRTRVPDPGKIQFVGSPYTAQRQSGDDEDPQVVSEHSLQPRFPLVTPSLARFRGATNDRGRYFYPFAGDEWWSWYRTRSNDLAKRLDEGEWYGCYTYGLGLADRVDDPMQGIFFRKREIHGDTYFVEALDCSDGGGSFNLTGEVNASDLAGTIIFRKQYASHVLVWEGLITPLGILGQYHRVTGLPRDWQHGYFWLWKRDWMDDGDV
ncbi:Uu.00g013000.m01.CDS01 [Anthostomella pinea]|uniref:Uu.00g013000.m01.CDS01 n=1 Tax=Anthostomella pinea TaxID=933095 RepID=A0AAI8VSA3_9PEZI|nr:Uu.00g013000.m01.CDS01 [Anthostomella pinea]